MELFSVGMIVKNEEQRIRKCLDALQALFSELAGRGVKSELVIVDTGSDDGTVQAVKEYTDKVYSFEWCDDFSAARNYGLSRCSGDWFMYLDADEVLDEDVRPLTEFLCSDELSGKYNSARLILKNYADEDCFVYTESRNLRLFDMKGEPCFKGAVHESLPIIEPCKQISQTVHHYGYIADSGESIDEKHRRNMPELLKLYAKDDKSPRTLAHLFYSCEPKDKERYLTEWYNLLNLEYRDMYSVPVYAALIQTLVDGKCYEDALFYAEEYLKSYGDNTVTTLSVLALTVCALSSSGQPEIAADFFESYDELYKLFKDEKIDAEALSTCVTFFGISESDYIGILLLAVSGLIKSGDRERAKGFLETLKTGDIPKPFAATAEALKKELGIK